MKSSRHWSRRGSLIVTGAAAVTVAVALGTLVGAAPAGGAGQQTLPTTPADFFEPGTQPFPLGPHARTAAPIQSSNACTFCHAEYFEDQFNFNEPWDSWVASMMGQAARDPVWHAALAIANQDATDSGESCIRCHSPGAWLAGRSLPADASDFVDLGFIDDFDGVTCHFCHRNVNPVLEPDSPPEDVDVLAALAHPPAEPGNGRYVVDPEDVHRGPFFKVPQNLHGVPIIPSPFHRKSELCANCHQVGNPVFSRQQDGSFGLNAHGAPHPTERMNDMPKEQSTYGEWLNSTFADGGVYFPDRRFGGDHPTGWMSECQDCHMPDQFDGGCFAWAFPPFFPRTDLPQHSFAGTDTWVMRALRVQYDDGFTGLSENRVNAAISRNLEMLRAASDLEVVQRGDQIVVRVINFSGHKLPTGYPEGRRMWLNVEFLDPTGVPIAERGVYDADTAELFGEDTKVYETKHGLSEDVAAAVNLPAGPSFHLVLNNVTYTDNRIPPVGFRNDAFKAIGAAPVAYEYADGQYWDDTEFDIPAGAGGVMVTLYYQSMTKEYIEFLRNANETNHAGDVVYDLWANPAGGNKVPPVDMDVVAIPLGLPVAGNVNGDGLVDLLDLLAVLSAWGPCPTPTLCAEDTNCDDVVDLADVYAVLLAWSR